MSPMSRRSADFLHDGHLRPYLRAATQLPSLPRYGKLFQSRVFALASIPDRYNPHPFRVNLRAWNAALEIHHAQQFDNPELHGF